MKVFDIRGNYLKIDEIVKNLIEWMKVFNLIGKSYLSVLNYFKLKRIV